MELAEILAGVAAALEDWLPETDIALAAVVVRDGALVKDLTACGLLLVRTVGELGLTIGRGVIV